MKKLIYIFSIFCSFSLLHACIEDEGNYVYEDLIKLSVDSLKESYQVRSMVDNLVIIPEITSSGDYNCLWMMYPQAIANPEIDTISTDKELNYPVTESAGTYSLVLCVTDNQTGDAAYETTTVNVSTIYTDGWYILKEIDGATDMDMFTFDGEKIENLLSNIFDNHMEGLPMDISYTPAYTYIDKEYVKHNNDQVFWVCSDQNVYMLKLADMSMIYEHDELFYGDAPIETPYHIGFGAMKSYYTYMSSNGLYYYHGMTPSSGKFGSPLSLDDGYELGLPMCNMERSTLYWDQLNSRFIALNNGSLRPFQDKNEKGDTVKILPSNMNCDLLMLDRTSSKEYAVLKERTTGEILALELDPWAHDNWSPLFYNPINDKNAVRLPASHEMATATHFAQNHNLAYIYYAKDNSVNMLDFLTSEIRENDIITFGTNECVTFIKHLFWKPMAPYEDEKFEYLVVGTNHGDEYTLYLYELLGGVPDKSKEVIVFSGTGKIKDVQFISSQMNMFTGFSQYPID